jgi:lipid-binding SYLF domain-containing protein
MKRIGILFGMLVLSAGMILAQDSTSTSGNNDNSAQSTTTTTTTTSHTDQNNTATPSDQTTDNSRKRAAVRDENAADAAKDQANDAGTKSGEEHDKAIARLDDSAKDLNQLLAAPDNGIPDTVFTKAKCVAVVPSMIKGGFIFGAEHGRGVASCRLPNGGWSAPAFFTMTGGSWGAQIGAEGVDVVMLIMNDNGMNQLLSAKFKIGGAASASAGPVGRDAAASTSWKMNSEILTYSRSRGLFAGATLNGTAIHSDDNAMQGYYGRNVGFRPVLTGKVKDPAGKDAFVAALQRNRAEVNAQAH